MQNVLKALESFYARCYYCCASLNRREIFKNMQEIDIAYSGLETAVGATSRWLCKYVQTANTTKDSFRTVVHHVMSTVVLWVYERHQTDTSAVNVAALLLSLLESKYYPKIPTTPIAFYYIDAFHYIRALFNNSDSKQYIRPINKNIIEHYTLGKESDLLLTDSRVQAYQNGLDLSWSIADADTGCVVGPHDVRVYVQQSYIGDVKTMIRFSSPIITACQNGVKTIHEDARVWDALPASTVSVLSQAFNYVLK